MIEWCRLMNDGPVLNDQCKMFIQREMEYLVNMHKPRTASAREERAMQTDADGEQPLLDENDCDGEEMLLSPPISPTASAAASASEAKRATISMVAKAMGYLFKTEDWVAIGVRVAKKYSARHGHAPPKCEQKCNGRATMVNLYTEADRDLIEGAIREHVGSKHGKA
jgi:hypothetical protein